MIRFRWLLTMADLRTNIATLLLADFKAEAEGGFPTVRPIPSTDAVKFLDYFAALNSAEAAALLDTLAHRTFAMSEPPSGTRVQDFWRPYAWNYLTEENAPARLIC